LEKETKGLIESSLDEMIGNLGINDIARGQKKKS